MSAPVLYLAWQDATSRRWFPVGRVRRLPDRGYEFVYVRGFDEAREKAGMLPIIGFPDPSLRYLSDTLFPHFQNRIMPRSREDYPVYIENLGFSEPPSEPLAILARSGGRKVTDSFSFSLFPEPAEVVMSDGECRYAVCFFIHGMRYAQPAARARGMGASRGERLLLMADFQNSADTDAFMLRTDDNHLLGWVPRFYCADIQELHRREQPIKATVEHVNAPSTPSWLGVMCRIEAPWPTGFRTLRGPEYEVLARGEGQALGGDPDAHVARPAT
jgi:hypothetical protein